MLAGEWACHTFKLGGIAPLTVYAQFKSAFEPDGTAFTFEKLTGSPRTMGRVTMQDRTMIYIGVGYVADEPPMAYADSRRSQIRRILFPAPINESDFDLLYLTR